MTELSFVQRLVDKLGTDAVITSADEIAPWLSDWRDMYRGQAQAVVRPSTTDEVAACLALCSDARVPVVPRGGNTGLCGAATPDASSANVILSLDRMNAIRNIDTIGNTMVAEAGCILGNLRRAAQERHRLLPLSLAAEDSCQLGGNLSTNAGGVNVVRYGMTRELVLGLEAVLPNGEIFQGLRTLRKDNTGYDLKQLMIGAEGTLGVVTAAAVKLFPILRSHAVAIAGLRSVADAGHLLVAAKSAAGLEIEAFELICGLGMELVVKALPGARQPLAQPYPWYVLIEIASARPGAAEASMERLLGDTAETALIEDAVVAQSEAQA